MPKYVEITASTSLTPTMILVETSKQAKTNTKKPKEAEKNNKSQK